MPDGLIRGLYFVLQPSGKASWAIRYRLQRQTRKLTIGTYPAIDLKAARDLASQALVKVASGADPAAEKQATNKAVCVPTDRDLVERVVEQFVERYAKAKATRSWQEIKRVLEREVVGRWRGARLSEKKRPDVHEMLDEIVDRGSPVMANRVLAYGRRMGNWAVERGLIDQSPFEGVKAPYTEKSRDRILSDQELKIVWQACDRVGWPFGPLTRLLILTGQRRDEVGGMRWSEIDLSAKTWTLPKERVKNGVEHIVPLSPQVVAILESLPRIAAPKGYPDFIFTSGGCTPVSGYSKAKARLDFFTAADRAALPHWRMHDLRRTFASGCAKRGVSLPVIEKMLNHVSGSFGGIVGVYQRHSFFDEKVDAINSWGRYVEEVVSERAHGNVLESGLPRSARICRPSAPSFRSTPVSALVSPTSQERNPRSSHRSATPQMPKCEAAAIFPSLGPQVYSACSREDAAMAGIKPKKNGRPTAMTEKVLDEIVSRLAGGESVAKICRENHMPDRRNFFRFLDRNDDFLRRYMRAKQIGLEALADDILDIADDTSLDAFECRVLGPIVDGKQTYTTKVVRNSENIKLARLRINARKWLVGKLALKKHSYEVYPSISAVSMKEMIAADRPILLQPDEPMPAKPVL